MWTWTELDADSKLIVSYLIGGRDAGYASAFMDDVASRLATGVQLTTDAHPPPIYKPWKARSAPTWTTPSS